MFNLLIQDVMKLSFPCPKVLEDNIMDNHSNKSAELKPLGFVPADIHYKKSESANNVKLKQMIQRYLQQKMR